MLQISAIVVAANFALLLFSFCRCDAHLGLLTVVADVYSSLSGGLVMLLSSQYMTKFLLLLQEVFELPMSAKVPSPMKH